MSLTPPPLPLPLPLEKRLLCTRWASSQPGVPMDDVGVVLASMGKDEKLSLWYLTAGRFELGTAPSMRFSASHA